ncbi:MAG: TonB-dependent receptor [Sphingomonadaceae bacterium]|nr:TonB-dependent receptor [Sphingomonadaceae bacterium]
MINIQFRAALLTSAALLTGLSATQATAQDDPAVEKRGAIGDIVVTARKREENLQDTPLAITAVTSETLESRGIENFIDISRLTPNMKIHETPGGLGAAFVAVRGIAFGDNVIGNDAPIGFYIDGVAYGRISTIGMDIVEPDSVQVLRGPQGTLFGRNTTAGAIVIQTHTPTDEFSGVVRGSWGSFDAASLRARIDTGYIGGGNVKASFAYAHRERDGIQDNVGVPDHLDPGANKSDAYWGKIVGEFGALTATVSADYTKMGGVPITLQAIDGTDTFLAFLANSPSFGGNTLPVTTKGQFKLDGHAAPIDQRVVQKGVHLNLEYVLNDNLTAKAIGAFRGFRRDDTNNYGPGNLRGPIANFADPANPSGIGTWNGWYGFDERFQKQNQKTLEVQLLGDYESLRFVLGGYYFDEHARDFGTTHLPFVTAIGAIDVILPRDYTVDSKSKAAYAQVDYRPAFANDRLELSGGIRYTDDTRFFDQIAALDRELNLKTDNWSYMLGASYDITDGLMGYIRYSTGYRSGGFNVRTVPPLDPVYQPEKIKAWEAGFKLDALDNRLRLNVAAFFNKYNNLQINSFTAPSASSGGGSLATNANAEYKGIEVEVTLVPVDGLTLAGSFGYVDSEYKQYPRALGTGGAVFDGCSPIADSAGLTVLQDCGAASEFLNVPSTQWDIDATYRFPPAAFGVASAAINYSWRGSAAGVLLPASSMFADVLRNPSYGLLGARIAISEIPINDSVTGTVALFGRNLTDKRYGDASIDFGNWATKNFANRRAVGVEGKIDF